MTTGKAVSDPTGGRVDIRSPGRSARAEPLKLGPSVVSIPTGGLRTMLLSPLVSHSIKSVRFAMVANYSDELVIRIDLPGEARKLVFPELRAALGRCFARLTLPPLAEASLQGSDLAVWEWSRSTPLVLVRNDLAIRLTDSDFSTGRLPFEEILTAA